MIGSTKTDNQISQARALLDAGLLTDASNLADTLLLIAPGRNDVKELLVDIALQQGDGLHAMELLEELIEKSPRNHEYQGKAGVAFALAGKLSAARNHLILALQLKPDYLHALIDLCKVARSLGLYDESIKAGTAALAIEPDGPALHSNLALSYELYGLYIKAREHYERAAILCPEDPDAQQKAAVACLFTGAKQEAKEYFQKAIKLNPQMAAAYRGIAVIDKYTTKEHEDFTHLQTLLDAPAATDDDRIQFHFALGKMYDDCGEYEQAFEHFNAGNQLEDRKHDFHPSMYRQYVGRLINAYTPELLSNLTHSNQSASQPVFIVGMPRSGSTLVEQIIASHPEVYGAGELPWFAMLENALPSYLNSDSSYPECVNRMTGGNCRLLSGKYLDYQRDLTNNEKYSYITDKMPDNYERVGLIWLLFPNARIIHCKRDPLDNAVSQFNLLFPGRYSYSYDLFNLGACYTEKERLMAHWKSIRPEYIHDVVYEELVRDQEHETRRMLEFLGLPWDDRCMKFFELKRSVHTASHSQVNKPMYSDSIGRWKHYEEHLEPLQRGLRWPEGMDD